MQYLTCGGIGAHFSQEQAMRCVSITMQVLLRVASASKQEDVP